jgi:hypothetical protein
MKSTAALINDYREARLRGDWKRTMELAIVLELRGADASIYNKDVDDERWRRLNPDPPDAA